MNYYSNRGGNFLSAIPQVTRFLLVTNVAMFLIQLLLDLTSPHLGNALRYYTYLFPIHSQHFEAYQLITHMFMHGGFMHLFLNMFGLYMFGRVLENVIGSQKFFMLYFLSGLGAAGLQLLIFYLQGNAVPMLGASGAVYGVVAAFAFLFPNTELMIIPIPIPIKAKYLVPGFLLLGIFMGISNRPGDNVAHFAHLGGAIIGFIFTLFWKKNQFRQY